MVDKVILITGIVEGEERWGGETEIWELRERLAFYQVNLEERVAVGERECGKQWDIEEGCVYITDVGNIAEKLKDEGGCVVFWLKERNKGEPFRGIEYAVEALAGVDGDYLEQVYRRNIGEPWEILVTERLVVREMTVGDLEDMYELYSHESITRYMGSLPEDREEERRIIVDYIKKMYGFFGFGVYMVVKKESNEVIGRAGFSLREGFEHPELGFLIRMEEQGKGYAYEACKALMAYGFQRLEFEGIQSIVRMDNLPSLGLCRRLGMKEVERLELDGEWYARFIHLNL